MTVIAEAFPSLVPMVGGMRTVIEKTDICRLALMHLHGGIYADLDQELVSVEKMQKLLASGRVYLPFEKGRLVGQAILISPPGHPLWATLAHSMVSQYDPRCYETMNTGPDKLTALWNEAACAPSLSNVFQSVSLHEGLDGVGGDGAIVRHLRTGSWKQKRNKESASRKAGRLGCTFARMNVTCFTLGDVVTKLHVPPRLKHALSVDKPIGQVLYDGHKPPRYGYDNAMSINGVRLASGEERFVARLCDAKCAKGRGMIKASTIAFGGMSCGSSGRWSGPCRWTSAREVRVGLAYPKDRAWLNGPEDARIDVLNNDKLFALANVPSESCGHGRSWGDLKMRDMAYVPLSESSDGEPGAAIACRIQVKRTDRCRREKNWSPLVIDGRIYLVYSLEPFQVLSFDTGSCSGTLVTGEPSQPAVRAPNLTLRGSTRYVHGLSTTDGEIYWSIVHTQADCTPHEGSTLCQYEHRVAAILARGSSTETPTFAYLGTAPDVAISTADFAKVLTNSGHSAAAKQIKMAYVHSLTSFVNGIADIGFHINDDLNFRVLLYGIKSHLALMYQTWARKRGSSPHPQYMQPRLGGSGLREAWQALRRLPAANPAADRAADIAIVTDFVFADTLRRKQPWLIAATRSKRCYAKRHGYAFYSTVRTEYSKEERAFVDPPVLQKTRLVRKYLDHHAWVLWMDYDAIIINWSIPLDILTRRAEGFDVIAADGGDEINAGVFAVRNSTGGREFLRSYENDAARAAKLKGHLPWRDNGYMMHAVLRGIVQDKGVYRDECFNAGLHGSKGMFKRCFWSMRKRYDGFPRHWIDGPPRTARAPQRPNWSSNARYRAYMSNEGIMNNLLSWEGPNRYVLGDLVLHFAGPNKSALLKHLNDSLRSCHWDSSEG